MRHPIYSCLAAGIALSVLAALSHAQQVPDDNAPGYLAIKVNIGSADNLPGGINAPGLSRTVNPFSPIPGTTASVVRRAYVDPNKFVIAVVPHHKIFRRNLLPAKPTGKDNPKWSAMLVSNDKGAINTAPFIYTDGSLIQLYKIYQQHNDQMLVAAYAKWKDKGRAPDGLLDIIADAISYGQDTRAISLFNEYVKLIETRGKQHTIDPHLQAVAQAYVDVKGQLDADRGLPPNPEETVWKDRFRIAGVYETPHYAIFHYGDARIGPELLAERAKLLETNYRLFFLWNAYQGRSPRQPQFRLPVLIAAQTSDIARLREALQGQPVVADALYSPIYDILVLSPTRMDDAFQSLEKYLQDYWRNGWSRDELLGLQPMRSLPRERSPQEFFKLATLAYVGKMLEEESAYAGISREANRQLFAATGLVPRYVSLPLWVEYGLADLLAKPKSPVINIGIDEEAGIVMRAINADEDMQRFGVAGSFGNRGTTITVALAPGFGAANYALARKWKELKDKGEISQNYSAMLRNVITDRYFYAARAGEQIDLIIPSQQFRDEEVPATSGQGTAISRPAGFVGGPPPGVPGGSPFVTGPTSLPTRDPRAALVPGTATAEDPRAERKSLIAKLELKAQVLAWALTHYLNRDPGLSKKLYAFYAELGRMPRDMYLDPELVLMLFCQAFDLMAPDRMAIDERKFDDFARDWIIGINAVRMTGHDIPLYAFGVDPTTTDNVSRPPGLPPPGMGPLPPR